MSGNKQIPEHENINRIRPQWIPDCYFNNIFKSVIIIVNRKEVFFLDGISFLEASILYAVLLFPLLTILLLLFWASANMKNTAKAQLFGIVILIAAGFLAINSPIFFIIEATALILLVVWIFTYRDFLLKGQLSVILLIFALQVAYYILFFVFIGLEYNLAITLLCISPILSMLLLYPWAFGNKSTAKGRVLIILVFIIQVIHVIFNIVLG